MNMINLREYLYSLKTSNKKIRGTIIYESRFSLLVIIITGLSRALSEVGAVIIVGGNIDNLTRVMTTSIVLETSRGELSLALSLGITLLSIALVMNILISIIKGKDVMSKIYSTQDLSYEINNRKIIEEVTCNIEGGCYSY